MADKQTSPVYLDCNATTPIEPEVAELVKLYLEIEFGNAGSRTHQYGQTAKQAVNKAREQIATAIQAKNDEVIFTSGATESNNMALLGLAEHGRKTGKKHIITTAIEHKAVLEPCEILQDRGFELTVIKPEQNGRVDAAAVLDAVRDDTLFLSVMHVNNETGVIQPIEEIAAGLEEKGSQAFYHVDAAQSFGKLTKPLHNNRIDLVSLSAHKVYGPKGIGALVARRRGFKKLPLEPLMYGGGQERGLRPGTAPVPVIAGFGLAAEIAANQEAAHNEHNQQIKARLLDALDGLEYRINGDPQITVPHTVNLRFPGIDSEALILGLKDQIAISNGSACTSQNYTASHVLKAMGLSDEQATESIRISWCHMTGEVDWEEVAMPLKKLAS